MTNDHAMKCKIILLILIFTAPLPRLASGDPGEVNIASQKDIHELTSAIKDNSQLLSSGQSDIAQAAFRIYREPDVQRAIKSLPELASKVNYEAVRRADNTREIGFFKVAMVKQIELFGDIQAGMAIALKHVTQSDKDDEQTKGAIKGAAWTFVAGLLLALLKWLWSKRKRDK